MIDILTPIWQRVLKRSALRVDDNFFDLGGNPSLGSHLMSDISEACGREVSPLIIFQAPSIATLAAELAQPGPTQFPPFVLFRSGSENPPVFMAHGLGGSVAELFQLARHIRTPHPIYGIHARGMDGVAEPLDCIEDIAEFNIDAIKKVQPHGPYLLIGYSLGGLIVLEMAQRLAGRGEKVGLLAMLDSYPHTSRLRIPQRVRLLVLRTRYRVSKRTQSPLGVTLSRIFRRALRKSKGSGQGSGDTCYASRSGASFAAAMERVRKASYLAWKRYRPRFYEGRIKFVRAGTRSTFPADPAAVWAGLAQQFDIETVQGDHLGIITTHSEKLASALSRYLREASCAE